VAGDDVKQDSDFLTCMHRPPDHHHAICPIFVSIYPTTVSMHVSYCSEIVPSEQCRIGLLLLLTSTRIWTDNHLPPRQVTVDVSEHRGKVGFIFSPLIFQKCRNEENNADHM
jgi:hypothetical protein